MFLKLSVSGVVVSLLLIWQKMVGSLWKGAKPEKIFLPVSRRTVSFFGNFIEVNRRGRIQVFSSHCTHLGCLIDKEENGKLVCPCHGSVFDLDGNAVKGPAYKPLKTYPFQKTEDGDRLVIQNKQV